MKTVKYKMEIYLGDNMLSTSAYLSKKDYLRMEDELSAQHLQNDDQTNEFYTEYECYTYDKETYKVTKQVFAYDISDVRLIKFECKEGYYFN